MKFTFDDTGTEDSATASERVNQPLLASQNKAPSNTQGVRIAEQCNSTTEQTLQNKSVGVIKRVLFTRTEFTIYPNGQTYQKTTSWFDSQTYKVVKKVKKKAAPIKKVKMKTEEVY